MGLGRQMIELHLVFSELLKNHSPGADLFESIEASVGKRIWIEDVARAEPGATGDTVGGTGKRRSRFPPNHEMFLCAALLTPACGLVAEVNGSSDDQSAACESHSSQPLMQQRNP